MTTNYNVAATLARTATMIAVASSGDHAPTVTVTAIASPSPGVRIQVSSMAATADTVSVWRTGTDGVLTAVRGAVRAATSGTFSVDEFEAPIGQELVYTATTYTIGGVQSLVSAPVSITLASTSSWISDPIVPATAVPVIIQSFPDRVRSVDNEILPIIGTDAPVMVAGLRQKGTGVLTLVCRSLDELRALRTVLVTTPVILLRCADPTYDLDAEWLGVTEFTEKRVGPLAEGSRIVSCSVVWVTQPAATISGPLHTWAEVVGRGYSWRNLADADFTWLQLVQQGGL